MSKRRIGSSMAIIAGTTASISPRVFVAARGWVTAVKDD